MGRRSIGPRNMNAEALAHALDAHDLFARNTAFSHATRHTITYQHQRKDHTAGLELAFTKSHQIKTLLSRSSL